MVSPVQKVIQMLTDMKAKGVKELETEKAIFGDYQIFVTRRTRELTEEIADSKAQIEKLVAIAAQADSDVADLKQKIAANEEETASGQKRIEDSTTLRNTERAEFEAQETDYAESLDALDNAIQVLMSKNYDRSQALMLLQRMSRSTPGLSQVVARLAMLQDGVTSSDAQPSGAPAVNAYEFQSGGVIEMLKQLRVKFKAELGDLQKGEMNSQQAYDMLMVHTTNAVSNLQSEHEELIQTKASKAAESAQAKGEIANTKKTLADAEKFLVDVKATYEAKAAAFESNQGVRTEELEALSKAIEILSDPSVTDNYAKHVKSLMQRSTSSKVPLLIQMRSSKRRVSVRARAAKYLHKRAGELDSKVLAGLASQVIENPFAKVIEMIENLLAKLKEDAASEAEHKAYCDEELKKNKLKRDSKKAEIARLAVEIEKKGVAINLMAKKIATLSQQQADLQAAMQEATEKRDAEKKANLAAIKEAKEGLTAVKQATLVLKEFYASQQAGFLQIHRGDQVPEMARYKGLHGGGVISMLEVIESDFARVEADTTAAENQATEEYKNFMDDAEADLKSKHDAEFKLSIEKDQVEFEKEQLQKDHDVTKEQLDAAKAYYEELKPQCVTVNVSYEERAKRRQEEIEALKEAYKILDSKPSA